MAERRANHVTESVAMNIEEEGTKNEAAIRELVDDFVQANRAKDLPGVLSVFAPDVVSFDLGPPLQHERREPKQKRKQALFDSFQHPIEYEVRDLTIAAGDDLAFSHSLNCMSGTMTHGRKTERWLRWTACYRKTNDTWLIVHEQVSVPVDLVKGTAVLDLKP